MLPEYVRTSVALGCSPMHPQWGICYSVLPHAVHIANTGGATGTRGGGAPRCSEYLSKPLRRRLCLQSLLAIAAVAVPTAAGLLLLQPLLFRRLQVRHILTVLPQHTAPVDLAAKPLQGAIDGLVVAYFYTYSQSGSLVIPV